MEEQKKELQENQETGQKPEEQKKEIPARSFMLMCLGGLYLLYTGYKLCKNVLDGVEGASWGFFVAGVAFVVIGAVMLFFGVRDVMRRDKAQKAAEAAEKAAAEQEAVIQQENLSQNAPEGSGKGMSIAERARLASRLSGDDEEEEPEEEA